jgi:hypothetical protein
MAIGQVSHWGITSLILKCFVAHRKSSLSAFNLHAPYFIGNLTRQAWARNIVACRRNLLYGIQGRARLLLAKMACG